jgi:hypothetical protein
MLEHLGGMFGALPAVLHLMLMLKLKPMLK